VPYVVRGLSELCLSLYSDDPISRAAIDAKIKSTFQELDDEILNDGIEALKFGQSNTEILSRLAPGYAGSCALLSMYDRSTKLHRVA
jgi:pyruvate dehydrogenase phosphatase